MFKGGGKKRGVYFPSGVQDERKKCNPFGGPRGKRKKKRGEEGGNTNLLPHVEALRGTPLIPRPIKKKGGERKEFSSLIDRKRKGRVA